MSVKLLHSSQPDSWKYVPILEARIRAFINEYSSDVNADYLIQWLRMSFISNGPTALMLVAVDDDGIVTGHLVALAEQWFGKPVVSIIQLESDEPLTPDVVAQGEHAIRAFAIYSKAEHVQIAARNKAAARLFARRGFVEGRVLMKRPVHPVKGQALEGL